MSGPDDYCKARMRGLSAEQAASEAGYSGKQATYEARQLWAKVEVILDDVSAWPSSDELEDSIVMLRARITRMKQQLQSDVEWARGLRIARGE